MDPPVDGPVAIGEPAGVDRDRRVTVAEQARSIAAAWSPPDAPPSWWLTAATFTAIAEDDELLSLAAAVPLDRLPPLVLSAALRFHLDERGPARLAAYYPRPGGGQPPPDEGFRPALQAFARSEASVLARLCREHRYQMNEVGRCLDVVPALAAIAAEDPRPLALVDLGTGAGLGLHLDRYHYTYRLPDGTESSAGDVRSPVRLSCSVRGRGRPPVLPRLPAVALRLGVDAEPLDLTDAATARWLAACVPPEVGAVTRFAAAVEVARAHPAPGLRGDLVELLPTVVEEVPPDTLLCLVDTYVHVFLPPERLSAFREAVARIGQVRDVEWISVDPLVPLGPAATGTVQGLKVPPTWLRDNRDGGVFGVIGRVNIRNGVRRGTVLGRAHPGAAWLEWTAAP
ncbi:hypothetical protein SAMN05660657_04185 [Geodermatophilus amargosae]|uniref:DUF2332 domain-containing protein n=1 Tax=Geodermatophilus amargosae TaxID=1296565 RepID=A0A1I7C8C6_9ACTN|nr:hypothetical protein SAMN05660657_04185 [Geodermatophilus amargosae]